MPSSDRKYLVVGPAWVGDMVMAQSLFLDLKDRYPNCVIDVLAPKWTAALTDRMPQVNQLISSNFQHGKLSFVERWKMGRRLRAENYSHAIILPNSLKAALVPAIAGAATRTGFIGEQRWGFLNDIRRLDKSALPMTVQRFISLGREKGFATIMATDIPTPSLFTEPDTVAGTINSLGLSPNAKVLALCPGAEFGESKKWPAAYYAQAAQHFIELGWHVWLLGSDKDISSCEQINIELSKLSEGRASAEVLAGRTSLPQAVDLLSKASLVISNDSGLMHIAAGLNRPLVAVYGSTDPGHTPPLSHNHRVARTDIDCAPCFERECPLNHHKCMQNLTPASIISEAMEVLL